MSDSKPPTDLAKYIKNSDGDKVEVHKTSINIQKNHAEFLKQNDLNLSLMIRDYLDAIIKTAEEEERKIL